LISPPGNHASTVPPSQPLKQKFKDAFVALSLANLCYIKVGFDLLSDRDRFFDKLPVTPVMLLALAMNIFCLAFLVWLVTQVLRRFSNPLLHLVSHLAFFILLLLPVDFVRLKFTHIADYQIIAFLEQPTVAVCGLSLLALIGWKHRQIARVAAVAIAIFSPLAIFLFVKIMLICLGLTELTQCEASVSLPPLNPVRAGQPRVVWIIFDETDYRLTFENRPAGLSLPEFDRLRQQSFFATEAYPPGDFTLLSMPSLILGRRLSAVDASDNCDLSVTMADTGATADCSGLSSVFSEARSLGANTAAVGWYIPYDRLFGRSLNFCEWYPYPPFEPGRAGNFFADMRQQFSSLGETIHLRQMFVEIHRNGLQTSLSLVTNSVYGLTLLHLPAPHKPGIYLPEKNKFTAWGMPKTTGYFNNLALADRELGELQRTMQSSGQWDKTWIILSADHSWRESKLYDGKRDYRVPFLVKPPGATGSLGYSSRFNTVLTHDLILAILRGEVTNQQDVAHWVDLHGTQAAPASAKGIE
jgi:Sulfatase